MSRRHAAEAALVGIAAVWGLTFVMVQNAVEHLPVLAFLGYRFTAAAVIVAVIFRRELARLPRDGWRAWLAMGVFLTGGYLSQTYALEHTSASNAGFITGLFVVITPLIAALVLRERIGSTAWLAAAASAIGLFLLSGANGLNSGDLLALACAFGFALHILATSRAARSHDTGALLVVQLGVCGVFCLVVGAFEGELEAPPDASVWWALVITAVFASAVAYFVQTYAQRHAPPARTALILASEPAFAGLFGWLLAGDRLSAASWLGAVLIMAAIVAVEVLPRLRPPRPLPEG
ncbi:MAG TPA: DMT family transporter [Thermoleophilaceae bacterium]|nr:DMT family transporter [Thermoleophilaceae bacterium]